MKHPTKITSGVIIEELRARIERGELAAGDRVPSTREIMRRWGVAMATATKVLTALAHEGLVQAVPGIGTVVAVQRRKAMAAAAPSLSTARRRPASAEPLDVERVVTTAIEIADAEGLANLSMRRIATELGVATMSLYRHVSDKDDLLLKMMDVVFREAPLPKEPIGSYRDRLEVVGRTMWTVFRRHPWLAPAMSVTRPQLVSSGMAYTEWVLGALLAQGIDPATAFTTHITLFTYVRGTAVNLEFEAEAEAATGLTGEQWMNAQEHQLRSVITNDRFPTLARMLEIQYDFDLDKIFEFGLQRLLDGLVVHFEARVPGLR
ncbi:TetR/AcrR family transcriptional regulator C-terminal domain-containing protein [Labilithrix luteola]|uniref:TetR/AcrR family transcriptional regulator C-terminal domain-containing protein n=1 Tax=Labilithrix luteola TaxID=1391654 RepID=UPI000B190435|nr:TetR/AcrR family transcriptional regulator C-terminal domain-containing protein [Labilithrix luteola]